MKTEISRDSHQPKKRYSGVYQQQGRMLTDADWNNLPLRLSYLAVGMLLLIYLVMARINAETGLFHCEPLWEPIAVLIGLFGYKSGKEVDKFKDFQYITGSTGSTSPLVAPRRTSRCESRATSMQERCA